MMEHPIIKQWIRLGMLSLVMGILVTGCYYDNEECLYPEGTVPCDTTNVTFSGTIWPVINDNCIGCHSGGTPSGNVSLETYENISAAAAKPAGTYGSLFGAISHAQGNSPMPKNGNKLSDCVIRQVEIWIEAGTPNN